MTRLHYLGWIILATVLLSVTGCGSDDETSDAPPTTPPTEAATDTPREQVNWMGHWLTEDKRETLVREVAQRFEFENPGIDINLQFHQDIMGEHSKVRTAQFIVEMIETGEIGWDVIWLDDHIYRLVADELGDHNWSEQYLVNFEDVPGFTDCHKPFISQDNTYREQTGTFLVGPYIEGYYYALYYNAEVAAQMGLVIKPEGMTFDDLLGYVQAVEAYNADNDPDIAAFYESRDWTTLEILFQALVKSEVPDFEDVRAETSSEAKRAAILKTFEAFEQLGQHDPLIASHADNVWFETRDLVLHNQTLFYINGTWMYSHWHGLDPELTQKMIPVELPVFQPVDHYLGGYIPTFAVLKDAPNRDNAVRLLMHWCQPEVAEQWVRYTKNPTGILGNVAASELGVDPFEQFQSQITERYGSRVHYSANAGYLLGADNQLLQENLYVLLRQLLTGEITAQDAYDALLGEMN